MFSCRSGAEHNARVIEAGGEWKALGVVGGGAKHPTKAALAARLATFAQWPADRVQAPKTLADAGFFYTGVDDQVGKIIFFTTINTIINFPAIKHSVF